MPPLCYARYCSFRKHEEYWKRIDVESETVSHYKLKGTSGSVINRSFPIGSLLSLGSSEDCDVRIDEPGVAPRQAEIRLLDGKTLCLKNLADQPGTLLNGESVSEQILGSGDEIRIGSCRFMLQAPGLRPARVLTEQAVKPTANYWPRVLVWSVVFASAAVIGVLMWKPEWLPLP